MTMSLKDAVCGVVRNLRAVLAAGGTADSGDFLIRAEPGEGVSEEVPAVAAARDALRAFDHHKDVMGVLSMSETELAGMMRMQGGVWAAYQAARRVLDDESEDASNDAEHDALFALCEALEAAVSPRNLPTDFRVQWEIDTFDATTPREAAMEAFERMQAVDTHATVFTVLGSDGSSTTVDLSESDDADVAEWVGLHYARNFDAEPAAKKEEWRQRYREAHAA